MVKYIRSAYSETFDISRSKIENPKAFRVQDDRVDKRRRKSMVLAMGLLSIVVMAAELVTSGAVVKFLAFSADETETHLTDMDVITIGAGRHIKTGDNDSECTMNGILIDDGTGVEQDKVKREDIRLDAFGIFENLHKAYTLGFYSPIFAELYERQSNEIAVLLRNKWFFGMGLQMRASVTGVDGISKSYHMCEGAFENNAEIKLFLKEVAETLNLSVVGDVMYNDSSAYGGYFPTGVYTAELNHTFSDLVNIMNSVNTFKCDIFRVGKIENNTSGDIVVKTSQTAVPEFPNWFWGVLAVVAFFAILSGYASTGSFDDTEKLVILSRYVEEDGNCLASPITDLDKRANFGYTRLNGSPTNMCYGPVGEDQSENRIVPNTSGDIGGSIASPFTVPLGFDDERNPEEGVNGEHAPKNTQDAMRSDESIKTPSNPTKDSAQEQNTLTEEPPEASDTDATSTASKNSRGESEDADDNGSSTTPRDLKTIQEQDTSMKEPPKASETNVTSNVSKNGREESAEEQTPQKVVRLKDPPKEGEDSNKDDTSNGPKNSRQPLKENVPLKDSKN